LVGIAEDQCKDLADLSSPCFLDPDLFSNKGERVSLTRWFGWMDAAESSLPKWHSMLVVLLYIGIQLGTFKSAKQLPMFNKKQDPFSTSGVFGDIGLEAPDPAGPLVPGLATAEDPGHTKKSTAADSVQHLRKNCHPLRLQIVANVRSMFCNTFL
jgi:hypothetical protein